MENLEPLPSTTSLAIEAADLVNKRLSDQRADDEKDDETNPSE